MSRRRYLDTDSDYCSSNEDNNEYEEHRREMMEEDNFDNFCDRMENSEDFTSEQLRQMYKGYKERQKKEAEEEDKRFREWVANRKPDEREFSTLNELKDEFWAHERRIHEEENQMKEAETET